MIQKSVVSRSMGPSSRIRTRIDKRFSTGWIARRWNRRGHRLLCYLFVALLMALGGRILLSLSAPPKVEPVFDRIVEEVPGLVKDFALRDIKGALHTTDAWTNRPAIVLFFLSAKGAFSDDLVSELTRLPRKYGDRGALFLGVIAGTDVPTESAATRSLPFPILFDPKGRVAHQAGVRASPEAVVLGADGQVFYRGRIGEPDRFDVLRYPRRQSNALVSALDALLADEMPVVTSTMPPGTPFPSQRDRNVEGPCEEITFTKHVAPILWRNCVRCHRPGQIGPFSLLTYKDAAKRANFLSDVAASGRMPPWKPHPGVGVFLDPLRLSATETETLGRWAETGCKPGDLADLPPLPQFNDGWQLGEPDIILTMPEPYQIPAEGPDIYRSFSLPYPLGQDVTINGVEFRPGNRRVAHHSRIHLDETGDARRRERDDPAPGFSGWFGTDGRFELPYPGLGAWTPGMTPRFAPDGVGRLIHRGSDVVLQIHYHPTGKPETDKSSIGLFIAKKPATKTMAGYTLCTDRIDIPPGEKRHKVLLSTRIKADIHLYTVVPHAHQLCREFRLAATLPDGTTQPLLWITDWDMDWQDQYRFARPVRLPQGSMVTLAAYFDNSEGNPRNPNKPPRRVRYGVQTKDEMCACHLEFLCDDAAGQEAYKLKSPFGL
jgi:peroxiredoxin